MSVSSDLTSPPAPVDLDVPDLARWLDELACSHVDYATRWLQLVAAVQRDFVELCQVVPAAALSSVQARSSAEAIEALLARLREELATVLAETVR